MNNKNEYDYNDNNNNNSFVSVLADASKRKAFNPKKGSNTLYCL